MARLAMGVLPCSWCGQEGGKAPGMLNSNSTVSETDGLKGWSFLEVCVFWFLEQDVGTFVLLSDDRLYFEMKTHRELRFLWGHLVVCPKSDLEGGIWCWSRVTWGYGDSGRP